MPSLSICIPTYNRSRCLAELLDSILSQGLPQIEVVVSDDASSDDTVRLPGFVRFDAAVYAKIDETWSAQLNIENIFNKGYWASADGNNNISPGQGRTVRVMARAKF